MGQMSSSLEKSNGIPLKNKATILEEIDTAIKRKSPSIEYFVCLPYSQIKLPFLNIGFTYNVYGHSAVRYKLPQDDGTYKDIVMNIEAKQEPNLNNILNFYSTPDYLFDVDAKHYGVYARDILSVAYEDVPDEKLKEMHEYYENLQHKSLTGHKQFDIILGPIWNRFNVIFPVMSEKGNCAKWTSEGLKRAGIIDSTHIWPKSVWITMFENKKQTTKPTIVLYKKFNNYTDDMPEITSFTAPFDWIRSFTYRNPEKFADCIVKQKNNIAIIEVNPNPIKPNKIRNTMNNNAFIFVSVAVSGFLSYRIGKKGLHLYRNSMYKYRYNKNDKNT